MTRRLLTGYYEEAELWEMFTDNEIGYLDIATHIAPDITRDYEEYCQQHRLPQDERSAEEFLDYREKEFLDIAFDQEYQSQAENLYLKEN